ncbi:hypothetical protein EDD85DRAFT_792267 [Armillaria nabsnona]|nr:hypothetical protein EDD85DRAFT_792267 [Armillaria nabsnona]
MSSLTVASVQFYLKPRPISPTLGHSNYLPFKWPFEFKYTPFCVDHGPIPSDATEVYTVRSTTPALPASLSKICNEILPSLDTEVPDPNKLPRSAWPGLLQLAIAKANSSFHFQLECEDHIVQLVKGDSAPAPPRPSERAKEFSPEWYNIVYSTLLRGDVELRDESRDTELELFVWAYMFHVADDRGTETPGLLNSVSSKVSTAASAIASAFTAGTLVEENEPPPSSSNRLSATDAPSHAGNSGEEASLSAPNYPIRSGAACSHPARGLMNTLFCAHWLSFRPLTSRTFTLMRHSGASQRAYDACSSDESAGVTKTRLRFWQRVILHTLFRAHIIDEPICPCVDEIDLFLARLSIIKTNPSPRTCKDGKSPGSRDGGSECLPTAETVKDMTHFSGIRSSGGALFSRFCNSTWSQFGEDDPDTEDSKPFWSAQFGSSYKTCHLYFAWIHIGNKNACSGQTSELLTAVHSYASCTSIPPISPMPPDETTYIWDIDGTKKFWAKGEYCVHWIIVYEKPTMYTFECLQDHTISEDNRPIPGRTTTFWTPYIPK